ncbi:MAG: hypothetical protein WB392_08045 [Methanotrichaceae archaeon]
MARKDKQIPGKRDKIEKNRLLGKENAPVKTKERQSIKTESIAKEVSLRGPASGKLSLIQSTYGVKGNFELVVPLASGGLAHYTRNNDLEELPWHEPVRFGSEAGQIYGVSLIQSDFGASGNLELAAVDSDGCNLFHFWRDSGPSFDWHGPYRISENSFVPIFSGNPAMIQSNFGYRGNFEIVIPRVDGGFSYYQRDNDDPALPWQRLDFATDAGSFDAVTLIQSNFGDPGNLEMVARSGDLLTFFWRDSGPEFKWNGPEMIAKGIAGTPSMIQSTFGDKGNFELVTPMASGGLAYFWRDNDDDYLRWHGPLMFGTNLGKVESVGLIQSNFGEPGHLEIVAQVDGQLVSFWRDSGPEFRWIGPQYLTFSKTLSA